MRTLLIPLTDSQGNAGVLSLGFHLAQRFASHVTGLFIRPDPRAAIPFMGEGLTADAVQDLVEASEREGRERAESAKAAFEAKREEAKIADGDGVGTPGTASADWQEIVGFLADRLGREARMADLTIVPQPGEGAPRDARDVINEVLFRSGRPLLMAPAEAPDRVGEHVLIAWNGRAEGTRAVAAALPVLKQAGEVKLLKVDEEDPERPGLGALQLYLRRHGIESEELRRESDEDGVSGAILEAVKETGADLLVMGAYSHSRWREMVLGGVTRQAIQHAPVPVFMSH